MAEFRPVSSQRSDWGLFSPVELRQLMQIELERALRYDYPLTCLCISVDRLGHLQDLYGSGARNEIQDALQGLLKASTRDSDFPRCLVDDQLLALFPHTPLEGAQVLARRLLRAARALPFEVDGRPIAITLSIGLASQRDAVDGQFDVLVQRAQAGMALARAAGGDRCMRAEQAEGELDQIRRELEDLRRALEQKGRSLEQAEQAGRVLVEAAKPGQSALLIERGEDRALAERIGQLLAQLGGGPEAELVRQQVLEQALRGVHEERKRAADQRLSEDEIEMETLRRRVSKLTRSLSSTEEELRRVMELKNIDPGIASIYRTVQGLSADAERAEQKLSMLNRIFEANVELRDKLKPDGH